MLTNLCAVTASALPTESSATTATAATVITTFNTRRNGRVPLKPA